MTRKTKIISAISLLSIMVLIGLISIFYQVSKWYDQHQINFRSPLTLQAPVLIHERVLNVNYSITQNSPLTENQQYLCDKFGKDCRLALAIQHAENGTGACDRINWSNKNQSLDIGFMQINTLWVDKKIVAPSQLFDCKTNIDFAYKIYHANGNSFKDWSTFQNNSYKNYLY